MSLKTKTIEWFANGIAKAAVTGKQNFRSWLVVTLFKGRIIKMLDGVREKVAGYKTYIVAIGAIVTAFVAWSQGTMDTGTLIQTTVAALLGMTLKSAVTKAEEAGEKK